MKGDSEVVREAVKNDGDAPTGEVAQTYGMMNYCIFWVAPPITNSLPSNKSVP